jgi:hypothetical protein
VRTGLPISTQENFKKTRMIGAEAFLATILSHASTPKHDLPSSNPSSHAKGLSSRK